MAAGNHRATVGWPQPCKEEVVMRGSNPKLLILVISGLFPAIHAAQIETPLSPSEKAAVRFGRLVEPMTFVWSATGAAIGQWRDSPAEWGQGAKGLARRFAASEAFKITQTSMALGIDTALGLDPRYHRSHETRIWPRVRSAVGQTFLAYTDSGGIMFNYSQIGSSYGTSFL